MQSGERPAEWGTARVTAGLSRRVFVTRLAALGALTLSGARCVLERQTRRVPRIGFLLNNPAADSIAIENMDAFRQGLREFGYVDGETIVIEVRSAEGYPERLPALAAELVGLRPEVLVTAQPQAAVALKNATSILPIVIVGVGPSVVGITDVSRPGGNITGVSGFAGSLLQAKQLEVLKETVPSVSRVAVLWNPALGTTELAEMNRVAARLGVQIAPLEVRSINDFDVALAGVTAVGADALLVTTRVLALPRRSEIAEFAITNHLPSMHAGREFAEVGGLLSYAANSKRSWRRAASYVDRILKGARAGELPMEDPALLTEFVINLCTAAALRLTIPPAALLRVSEAIPCGR